ncbi:MAG: 5-formyltetrahydrofolate cyclo-ligase [Clostridia bacterium]|nr:5-formyltetrahydrofolate cyclo-ligase [Clostridia bacterium]
MNEKELRKNLIAKRESLDSKTLIRNTKIVTQALFSLDGFTEFSSYFVYKSFRGEVDTNEIIERLERLGKTVLYPVTDGDIMYAVKNEGERFVRDRFGVEVPERYTVFDAPDVVIVPLVACDKNLNRIGFGKGYYDRFLRNRKCLKIGICHDFQVVDVLEPKEWDVPLDVVITEKRVIPSDSFSIQAEF